MKRVVLFYIFMDAGIHAVSQRYEKKTIPMVLRRVGYGCVALVAFIKMLRGKYE